LPHHFSLPSCMVMGVSKLPKAILVLLGPALSPPSEAFQAPRFHKGLLGSPPPAFEAACMVMYLAKVSKRPVCYEGQPLPHLLKPSKLLGSILGPPCSTFSSIPSCPVMYLLRVSKLPFGSFGSTRPNCAKHWLFHK
jgi:hypothetical protein